MDILQGTLGLVAAVGFAVLMLWLGRELVCWYWKINAALEQLARLETVLRNIDQHLLALADRSSTD